MKARVLLIERKAMMETAKMANPKPSKTLNRMEEEGGMPAG